MKSMINKAEWPENLVKAIFVEDSFEECRVALDWRGTLEYLLISTLTDREEQVLRCRYQEGLTYHQIGEVVGVGSERIRLILNKTIRKFRHPSRVKYLRRGMIDCYKTDCDSCRELNYNRGYREGFRNGQINGNAAVSSNPYQDQEDLSSLPMETAPIDYLDLNVRTYNGLKRANINTIGVLISKSRSELFQLRNIGKRSLDDLEKRLQVHQLALREESATE